MASERGIPRPWRTVAGALLLVAGPYGPAPAMERSSGLVGTWQLTSYSQQFLDTKEVIKPFGEHPTGYMQYSAGGHFVIFMVSGDVPKPAGVVYTDAERAEIHRSMVGGYAGSYQTDGDRLVFHVLTAWRPEWNGTDQLRTFELNGNTLTLHTAPAKYTRTGQDYVATLNLMRVE